MPASAVSKSKGSPRRRILVLAPPPRWTWKWLFLALVAGGWWGHRLWLDYNGPVANYPPPNARIYMLGDSMTAGMGADPGRELPVLIGERLGRGVFNGGIPGETTGSALPRIPEILARSPGTVIILLGGNDVLQKVPSETAERNLVSMIEPLQARGSMIVLVSVFGRPGDGYGSMFTRLAKKYQCVYVPDVMKGLFFDAKYKADPVHPNNKGYEVLADRIAERVRPYLN